MYLWRFSIAIILALVWYFSDSGRAVTQYFLCFLFCFTTQLSLANSGRESSTQTDFECAYAQLVLSWYKVPEPREHQPLHQVLSREFDFVIDRIIERAKDFDVCQAVVGSIRILTQHLHNAKADEIAALREFSDTLVRNLFPESLWGQEVNRCALNEIVALKANKLKEGWSKFVDKMKSKKAKKKKMKMMEQELMMRIMVAHDNVSNEDAVSSREGSIHSQQDSDREDSDLSDLESYLTSVQEDMMEFKLSYEMWRVGRWAVSIPHVDWEDEELIFTVHLEENDSPENLQWDIRKTYMDVIYFRNRWQDEVKEEVRVSVEHFLQELVSDNLIGHTQPVFQFLCPLDKLLNEEEHYGGVWGLLSGLAYFLTPGQEEEENKKEKICFKMSGGANKSKGKEQGTLPRGEDSQGQKSQVNWEQLEATKAIFDLLKEISNSILINIFDAILKPVMPILKKVNSFLNKMNPTEAQMAAYIDTLREKQWPEFQPAAPPPPPPPPPPARTDEEKSETRERAHNLINARSNYLVLKKTDMESVFNLFQDSEENKTLVYMLLSFLLKEFFPSEHSLNVSAAALLKVTNSTS
uniref:Si:rp71-46j2.7 n=1 Tax=Seriola dumerili TaxID=41447 RepID=A0A3B4V3Q2_SERDU